MLVTQWGNSPAVRLPARVVKRLQLQEGGSIEIVIEEPRRFAVRKKVDADALVARLREFRGRLPADFHFSRDEVNQRG